MIWGRWEEATRSHWLAPAWTGSDGAEGILINRTTCTCLLEDRVLLPWTQLEEGVSGVNDSHALKTLGGRKLLGRSQFPRRSEAVCVHMSVSP